MAMKTVENWNRAFVGLGFVAALFLTALAYWPGLSGPFVLDDFYNLEALNNHGGVSTKNAFMQFVFGNESGRLGRPVSMLSFLINDQYWPSSSFFWKYVNLLMHLLVGVLIFTFSRLLLRERIDDNTSNIIAVTVFSLWMFHPLNVSTVLYVVQRMTQLSALFTLAGLITYCVGRHLIIRKPAVGLSVLVLGVGGFGALAVLSKENGLLLSAYIAVVESTLFLNLKRTAAMRCWILGFVVMPLLGFVLYLGLSWDNFQAAYARREFTAPERLITEARILCDYIKQILTPSVFGMGIFHDDIQVSKGLLSPVATLVSCAVVIALCALGFIARKSQPVLAFAILWFFAGHLMESTIIPLELYYEHRNYLPMFGPLLGVVYYAFVGLRAHISEATRLVLRVVPVGMLVLYAPMTAYSATVWGDALNLYAVMEVENRGSLRAKRAFAFELERHGQTSQAIRVTQQALEQHPQDLTAPLYLLALKCDHGGDGEALLQLIRDRHADARITDGLTANLERLRYSVSNGACPKLLDRARLAEVFQDIEKISGFNVHAKIAARIYFEHADLEASRGHFSASMQLLDKAFVLQPTVAIALKQTVMFASAGLYQKALERLALAKEADARRSWLTPSRVPELLFVERSIRGHLEKSGGSRTPVETQRDAN